ncbi:MAG: glycoside hydrolase family 2 TIM barrel-domain containing protein [Acidobacteriaceae bacterium]|nr:glycoside hydrolase family 2 TIM barrel-domain containing protein [Acidobacteriaceae bacterium]
MRRFALLLAASFALPLALNAAPPNAPAPSVAAKPAIAGIALHPRGIQSFTTGWRFLQADATGAERPAFDDSAWTSVTLPHDWAIAGPVKEDAVSRGSGGFFPTGVGWYRKSFTVAAADATPTAARRMFIVFDGVMANSDVYLNGELLGHRPYGYVSFSYELNPHLRPGTNVIAVRVDDSQQPASRWYPGAGINRQVRLVTTGDAHIAPWGTFVTTPAVSAESATLHIRTTVTNESATAASLSLHLQLAAPNGTLISTFDTAPVVVAPGASADLDAETKLARPDRWDLDHPVLYTVHANLKRDGRLVDAESVPFGIREFHFDADKGFFLNGVHHKIYGVALHTDAGAMGTAVPLAQWERRLTELRKLGVNAIRTAHNPPAPEFLDLADRMGFLVMDEFFDCWVSGKNTYDYHQYFKEWSLRDEADSIQRDRNHPSVILWSVGNEIHDTPHPDVAIPILKSLVDTAHKNDPTRPVTQALFRPNASHDYDDGLADLLDVVGQNYRPDEILKAHADKPTRKIIGTENTHDRNQWVALRDHPEYSGQFLWTGVDYLGEAHTWPTLGTGSGLLLSNSLPHGRAFERQSWWSTKPMVAMVRRVASVGPVPVDPGYANAKSTAQAATATVPLPADPTVRFWEPVLADWTPKNLAPHDEDVEIYTNAEEVELFLNGRSLGKQPLNPDAKAISFKVPFEPGTLKAVAESHGKIVATEELKTAGKPARLVFSADSAVTLTPDWNDARTLTATLVDEAGTRVPDSETVVHFAVSGPASVIAVDNGNMMDHEPFQATQRKLYYGSASAIVRASAGFGAVTVTASAEGFASATITLKTAPVSAEDPAIAKTSETERGF